MSYGILRVQKINMNGVKGIEFHDGRKGNGVSHTNHDINWERSFLNYDLHTPSVTDFKKAIKERIRSLNLPKAVRKDAVVMAQVLVTSDSDFFSNFDYEEQEFFFKDCYRFLCNRYGEENVISATVHLDEKTPHLHFNFVPVTADGRLSAKSIFTRQELIKQQDDFFDEVGSLYGLERGKSGGKQKHLDVIDYKIKTASESLGSLTKEKLALVNQINGLKDELKQLQAQKNELMGQVIAIQGMDEIELYSRLYAANNKKRSPIEEYSTKYYGNDFD